MRGTRGAGRLRAGGGQFSLPLPNRLGRQVPGAEPRRRGGPCGRPRGESSLHRRKRQSRGWCCAEPGAAVLRQGRRRARSAPGPRAQRAGHGGPRPAAWPFRCVGRTPVPPRLPSAHPRRRPPPAARCPRCPPAAPRLGAGFSSSSSFLSSCRRLPSQLSHVPLPRLLRDSRQLPCPSSSESPFLPSTGP